MRQYLASLRHVLDNGTIKSDRTGTGTVSAFGHQMRFNLQEGFPAVTTKRLAWRAVVSELLWFIEGSTDERRLAEILFNKDRSELTDKNTIWTANADNQGKALGYTNTDLIKELGPVYGAQWRDWNGVGIDQLQNAIDRIMTTPECRRNIVSAWNPEKIDEQALPPCHSLFQFNVRPFPAEQLNNTYMKWRLTLTQDEQIAVDAKYEGKDKTAEVLKAVGLPTGYLDCQMYQRSADMFLGVPFNIASYSLLIHIIASICNLEAGDFVHTFGDTHIYLNHLDQVEEQLTREPMAMPKLIMPKINSLNELATLTVDDFVLEDYNPMATIKADMAV